MLVSIEKNEFFAFYTVTPVQGNSGNLEVVEIPDEVFRKYKNACDEFCGQLADINDYYLAQQKIDPDSKVGAESS